MLSRDVVNQLHHVDGLTNTRTTKQTNLTAFCKRADKIDDLDASLKQLF